MLVTRLSYEWFWNHFVDWTKRLLTQWIFRFVKLFHAVPEITKKEPKIARLLEMLWLNEFLVIILVPRRILNNFLCSDSYHLCTLWVSTSNAVYWKFCPLSLNHHFENWNHNFVNPLAVQKTMTNGKWTQNSSHCLFSDLLSTKLSCLQPLFWSFDFLKQCMFYNPIKLQMLSPLSRMCK